MKQAVYAFLILLAMAGIVALLIRAVPLGDFRATRTAPPTATPSGTPVPLRITLVAHTKTVVVQATSTPAARVCTGYSTGHVNIRSCPSTTCRVLSVLPEAAPLQIVETRGDWHYVNYSTEQSGWIYDKYICRILR
jgi:hypothetical protein